MAKERLVRVSIENADEGAQVLEVLISERSDNADAMETLLDFFKENNTNDQNFDLHIEHFEQV